MRFRNRAGIAARDLYKQLQAEKNLSNILRLQNAPKVY